VDGAVLWPVSRSFCCPLCWPVSGCLLHAGHLLGVSFAYWPSSRCILSIIFSILATFWGIFSILATFWGHIFHTGHLLGCILSILAISFPYLIHAGHLLGVSFPYWPPSGCLLSISVHDLFHTGHILGVSCPYWPPPGCILSILATFWVYLSHTGHILSILVIILSILATF
jgi:hypothetical protein